MRTFLSGLNLGLGILNIIDYVQFGHWYNLLIGVFCVCIGMYGLSTPRPDPDDPDYDDRHDYDPED